MSDKSSKTPNLYQLLALQPLEADAAVITAALRKLKKRLEPGAELASDDRLRIERLLSLGQKYLLDPKNKAAYDRQWQAVYQNAASVSEASSHPVPKVHAAVESRSSVREESTAMTWNDAGLVALLPAGDPHAAFDLNHYLENCTPCDPLAAEADLLKLIQILSQSMAGTGQSTTDTNAGDGDDDETTPSPMTQSAATRSPSSARLGAVRTRQTKQRSLIIGGISLAAGVGGLLILGFYLSRGSSSNSSPLASSQSAATSNSEATSPEAQVDNGRSPNRVSPPRRSGLPQPGESAALPGSLPLEITSSPAPNESTSPAQPPPPPSMSAQPVPPPASTPQIATPSATMPETAVPQPTAPQTTTAQPTTEATPASQPLTEQDRAAWRSGMTEARQALSKLDVAAADVRLKQLSDSIKNPQQRQQWQRLSEIAGFIKDVREAMVSAIAGLSGGDTFKIGTSTVVSFVTGDDNKIVVRLSGTRREFALADMPVAMGVALIDLKMDVAHANSLARKGAYILLHPKNDVMAQRGKTMLADAAQVGAISVELSKFYEDDYSLAP